LAQGAYQVLLYAARYWFAALAVFIVWRAAVVSWREINIVRDIRRRIDGVATFAELVVTFDALNKLEIGTRYPFARDATLGSGSSSDVRIRHKSISRRHARLTAETDCVRVRPSRGADVMIGSNPVKKETLLFDGDEITLGGVRFRVKIEENIDVEA
jgi:hypothetical protein